MKTVSDLEEIKNHILHIFPDAIRGSIAKPNFSSRFHRGRKVLHLCYFVASDTIGGKIIQAKGDLFYLIEWDSNNGVEYIFAESDETVFIKRILAMFEGKKYNITKMVGEK